MPRWGLLGEVIKGPVVLHSFPLFPVITDRRFAWLEPPNIQSCCNLLSEVYCHIFINMCFSYFKRSIEHCKLAKSQIAHVRKLHLQTVPDGTGNNLHYFADDGSNIKSYKKC